MTDKELLLAISNMIEPVREDIQGIKGELREVKSDICVLKTELQEVKSDLQKVETDLQEVKDRVKKIELTQENIILPRLNTIESCYTTTYSKYRESVETYEAMKQDMSIVKKAVTEHSEKLQKIS